MLTLILRLRKIHVPFPLGKVMCEVVYDEKEAETNRKKIYGMLYPQIFPDENFISLKPFQIKSMFLLYDQYVFDGQLQERISQERSKVNFTVTDGNDASIAYAGCCTSKPVVSPSLNGEDDVIFSYDFEFPSDFYQRLFTDSTTRVLNVNGLKCRNRLECLQTVFEHELVHFVMMAWEFDLKRPGDHYTSHGTIYRKLVYAYFGHTAVKHRMLCGDASDEVKSIDEIEIGIEVRFKRKGKEYHGVVIEKEGSRVKVKVGEKVVRVKWNLIRV